MKRPKMIDLILCEAVEVYGLEAAAAAKVPPATPSGAPQWQFSFLAADGTEHKMRLAGAISWLKGYRAGIDAKAQQVQECLEALRADELATGLALATREEMGVQIGETVQT